MKKEINPFDHTDLMIAYLKDELTGKELERFEAWLAEDPGNREVLESFKDTASVQRDVDFFASVDVETGMKNVLSRLESTEVESKSWVYYFFRTASAAAIIMICLAVYKWKLKEDELKKLAHNPQIHESISPASDKAQLILADGSSIDLSEKNSLNVKEKDGTEIVAKGGQLIYSAKSAKSDAVLINILSTPKGGKYEMVLPDGSKVWLNASASLRFPTHFPGADRVVELSSGEAYFEIAKDKTKPFKVNVRGSVIEVTGTRFNVNAYGKAVKTTLAEGAVKIKTAQAEQLLRPRDQATVSNEEIAVGSVNVDKILAWKDGMFYFEQDGITEVMNQIAEWYDVDVVYKGEIPQKRLNGNIRRQADLTQVLQMLELVSDAKFETVGRKVIVNFKN